MKYAIVATPGWLLLVNLQSRVVQPLEFNRPEYYGISWFKDGTQLVLSHSGLKNADLVDIASYAQSEKGWLSQGIKNSRPFLSAPHQVICAADNRIVCTNTGRNVVTAFDFGLPNVFQESGLGTARWDRLALDQSTGDHLNSVFLRDNHLYAIAHGHTKGSKLATFSYPEMELLLVEPLGARARLHNIWVSSEGQRISCDTENGGLIDLDEEMPLWESNSPVYTRGLAVADNYVLVGESQKTDRDLRPSSLSGIWILDRQNWQPIDYMTLGPFGAVNEVRVLDVPDDAHHGHPFKGLDFLLSRDVGLEITKDRLTTSISAAKGRHVWTGWEQSFGYNTILADGTRRASCDQLCLMLRHSQENSLLTFEYSLEAEAGAHVSAVFGCQGGGQDCSMGALLLQPSNGTSVLSAWHHDGVEWAVRQEVRETGLPLSGTMQLATTQKQVNLLVDGNLIISLNAEDVGVEFCDRGLGIRWSGASVRPLA